MKDDQKRTFLAVILSGIILFGWQYFFAPKTDYTETMKNKTEKVTSDSGTDDIVIDESLVKDVEVKSFQTFDLKNKTSFFKINNQLDVVDAMSFENNSNFSDYFNKDTYSIYFNFNNSFEKVSFAIESQEGNVTKLYNEANDIRANVSLDKKGFLKYDFTSSKEFSFKIIYKLDESKTSEGSMFAFSQPKSLFGYYAKDYTSMPFGSEDSGDKEIKWASVDNEYHMLATVFANKVPLLFNATESGKFSLQTNRKFTELSMEQIFTRKEYDYLQGLGNNLDLSIDFGIWSIIAVPILRGLQFFYSVFPNYGISIILLTIIIRLLTFPLQYKSFKSMKKMQIIQPELNKVREKFKDNPQKMQQETMALFKKSGANPLGGCLPLILQMPIFFAFYRVLYSSVELVDAPFYFWINDLSQKDPFYVLPILMAFAMVLNQRLMPTTTTDPVQKKIMMFVPLIFAIFMKDFPAGLTLYIFVSTLVGMLQQLYVYKKV